MAIAINFSLFAVVSQLKRTRKIDVCCIQHHDNKSRSQASFGGSVVLALPNFVCARVCVCVCVCACLLKCVRVLFFLPVLFGTIFE